MSTMKIIVIVIIIILFIAVLNTYCHQTEDIVQCHHIDVNYQQLKKMNSKEQEELVSKL